MANSADNPSEEDSLNMDKDVPVDSGSDEEVDELALDMPEFKVPTGRHDPVDPSDLPEDEALEPAPEAEGASASEPSQPPPSGDPGFDREELVRTMRMDAFDRSQIELADNVRAWDVSAMLKTQKFAPDVLVAPPRVLTTKWQDGAATADGAGPHRLSPEDRKSMASTVRTTPLPAALPTDSGSDDSGPDEDGETPIAEESEELEELQEVSESEEHVSEIEELDEIDDFEDDGDSTDILPALPQEMELDSEAIVDEPKPPPPKPAPPAGTQRPNRERRSTRPLHAADGPSPSLQKQAPSSAPKPAPAKPKDDDDLNGIVQELLEEKKPAVKRPQTAQDRRNNWFVDVFSDEYLRTIPPQLHERTGKEVKFILDSLSLKQGARVLDLACGFGRHSIQLAKRGYEVAGLDLSMALLQRALNEAQRRSLSIKFIHGDMRELNFSEIFDACFCWETSFGYFDDRTNVEVLKGIHRALKPGGRLLIDVVNRDYVAAEMPSRTWWEGVDCVFLEEVEFDYNSSILHTKRSYIYEDGSPPKEFSSYIRLYGLHELRTILRFAGFRILEVSGEVLHRGAYLGPSSSRTIVLAERVTRAGGKKAPAK